MGLDPRMPHGTPQPSRPHSRHWDWQARVQVLLGLTEGDASLALAGEGRGGAAAAPMGRATLSPLSPPKNAVPSGVGQAMQTPPV